MRIGGLLHRNTETFLTHIFGHGLEDDRYVVERFKSGADGQIRPCEAEPAKGCRRKPRRTIVSRKAVREMRPERDEIIVCARLTGASPAGESPAGRRRPATTSTPSHGPPLARAGVKR